MANGRQLGKNSGAARQQVALSNEVGKRRGGETASECKMAGNGLVSQVEEHGLCPESDGKLVKGFQPGDDALRSVTYKACSGTITAQPLSCIAIWWHSI